MGAPCDLDKGIGADILRGFEILATGVEETPGQLVDVSAPTTLLQSSNDPVVSPESMTLLAQNLPRRTRAHWVESDRHNILRADPGKVTASVIKQLRQWRHPPHEAGG